MRTHLELTVLFPVTSQQGWIQGDRQGGQRTAETPSWHNLGSRRITTVERWTRKSDQKKTFKKAFMQETRITVRLPEASKGKLRHWNRMHPDLKINSLFWHSAWKNRASRAICRRSKSWTNRALASQARLLDALQSKGCILSGTYSDLRLRIKPFQECLQYFKG